LLSGVFYPRASLAFGSVILVGRELYRYGYMTNQGPNSSIREVGAFPLNIAELCICLLLTGSFLGAIVVPRMAKWGIVKRMVMGRYERILSDIREGKKLRPVNKIMDTIKN